MASSISVTSVTATTASFRWTLSSAFNADNYISVGVTNTPFENGVSRIDSNDGSAVVVYGLTDYNDKTTVSGTVIRLTPNTTYTFYGYARARNGLYYCIPTAGSPVVFTTKSGQTTSHIPEDLLCITIKQAYSEDTDCSMTFSVVLPEDAVSFNAQTSVYSDFSEIHYDLSKSVSELTRVSAQVYNFTVTAPLASTVYLRARVNAPNSSGTVITYEWCDYLTVPTPTSNEIFEYGSFGYGIYTFIDGKTGLFLGLTKNVLGYAAYDFTDATFTMYKDDAAVAITHIKKNDTLIETTEKYSASIKKSEFCSSSRTGVFIDNPVPGTYKGVIRVFRRANGKVLQPVTSAATDADFEKEITVEQQSVRPDRFEWNTAKVSGGQYNLTAQEWNSLITNINEVKEYKKQNTVSMTSAQAGVTTVSADIFNEVITAINSLGYDIKEVAQNEKLLAKLLNDLRDKINAIE